MYLSVNVQIEREDFDDKGKRDKLIDELDDLEKRFKDERDKNITVNMSIYDFQLETKVCGMRSKLATATATEDGIE